MKTVNARYEELAKLFDPALNTQHIILAYNEILRQLEWSGVDHICCPVCGGAGHHDSACSLAALLYPDNGRTYQRDTGDTAWHALLVDATNRKDNLINQMQLLEMKGI